MANKRKDSAQRQQVVTSEEVTDFTKVFSRLIDEGKSLVATLTELADAQPNARFQEILRAVNVKVRAGHPLSVAMALHPEVFDASYVDAVRLGEINGTLDQMLDGLSRGDEIFTLDQAVQFLGTSKPTLYRLLRQDALKGLRVGRQWRFRKTDLQVYMERKPEAVAVVATQELEDAYQFFMGRLREGEETAAADAISEDDKIIAIVNAIFGLAIRSGASDIHFSALRPQDSEEASVVVGFRVDGVMHEISRLPLRLLNALVGRIKVMADINAAQRDVPQDGRIFLRWHDRKFDVRVSSCPTAFGESVVMGLLDRSALSRRLEELQMAPQDLERLREWLGRPTGQIYFCGPIGSGRTTTLYAALQELNTPGRKLMTIEDPVEWQMPGVVQVFVDRRAGLTTASVLRTFLRQDPDVVMASGIDDAEAAQAATQLALTGHLLLSSMPVGATLMAAERLRQMGVEAFLITSTLVGLMAQRLARRICPHCREEYVTVAENIGQRLRELSAQGGYSLPAETVFARGVGCEQCHGTGYRGRVALYELVTWSAPLAQAFERGAEREEMMRIAIENGTTTMLADGARKAAEGHTTPEEVLRVCGVVM